MSNITGDKITKLEKDTLRQVQWLNDEVPERELAPVDVPKAPKNPMPFGYRVKQFFRKHSKKIVSLGVVAGTIAGFKWLPLLTLLDFNIMEDFSLIQMIVMIVAMLITFGLGYVKTSPKIKEKLTIVINLLADEIVKATDQKSDAGQKITRNEVIEIAEKLIKQIFGYSK